MDIGCHERVNLYLAIRSLRQAEPVLIRPPPIATAKSAMKVSSVSPLRWEITYPQASLTAKVDGFDGLSHSLMTPETILNP